MIETVKVRMKGEWIKLSVDAVRNSCLFLYEKTRSNELMDALMKAHSYGKLDQALMKEAGFMGKLLQLEASGYLYPPLNLSEFYKKVVQEHRQKISQKQKMRNEE